MNTNASVKPAEPKLVLLHVSEATNDWNALALDISRAERVAKQHEEMGKVRTSCRKRLYDWFRRREK